MKRILDASEMKQVRGGAELLITIQRESEGTEVLASCH